MKPRILIFVRHYLPAYRSGGPVRTIANLVDHLGDEFEFRVVTKDRDADVGQPMSGISIGKWNTQGKALVYYTPPEQITLPGIYRLLRDTPHDLLYLNSFFANDFTLLPLLARRLPGCPKRPLLIAPRGEFAQAALSLKTWKKRSYLLFCRLLSLHGGANWQASSQYEAADIRRRLGSYAEPIVIAPDPPPVLKPEIDTNLAPELPVHREGVLRVVFLSRITPMKNLDYALRILARVSVPVEFDIYGPVRDTEYWERCRAMLANMPGHITARYRGEARHHEVTDILAQYDLLLLPTRGENHGHVIQEAMSAGTPVMISDRTPWRGLEYDGLGYDLPLSEEAAFITGIETLARTTPAERQRMRNHIRGLVNRRLSACTSVEANRRLFLDTLDSSIPAVAHWPD